MTPLYFIQEYLLMPLFVFIIPITFPLSSTEIQKYSNVISHSL